MSDWTWWSWAWRIVVLVLPFASDLISSKPTPAPKIADSIVASVAWFIIAFLRPPEFIQWGLIGMLAGKSIEPLPFLLVFGCDIFEKARAKE